jgi:hypothetical protein
MKIVRGGFLLLVAFLGTMVIVNKGRFYYGWRDAFFRTLLTPFEDTVWAPGFSVKAFEQARLAMDKTEITRLLGEPLRKDCGDDGECFWIYSWHVSGTDDFDQRWVVFNREGKVSELRKSFFID